MNLQIFTYKNALMEKCLQELIAAIDETNAIYDLKYSKNVRNYFKAVTRKHDIFTLSSILLSGFVMHQGCYLRENVLPAGVIPNPEQEFTHWHYPDRTGYECYENHVHTMDVLKDEKRDIFQLWTGLMIADHWKFKLKATFPSVLFRIIVGYSVLNPEGDDSEVIHDCTVRFLAVRDGETMFDNLDDFKLEAMGVIEV